jgi:hypothetical protein
MNINKIERLLISSTADAVRVANADGENGLT